MAATDKSGDTFTVLIVPDQAMTAAAIAAAPSSSYTQAGPRAPGVCEPQGDYEAVVEAVGDMAAGTELRILGQRTGHPIPGGGELVWYYQGDADAANRGSNVPQTPWAHEFVQFSLTADKTANPHMVNLPWSDVVLVAYQMLDGAGNEDLIVSWRNTGTGAFTDVTVWNGTGAGQTDLHPCLVPLPDESVLCFSFAEHIRDGSGSPESQIRCHRSTDDGVSWTLMQDSCLRNTLQRITETGVTNYVSTFTRHGIEAGGADYFTPQRMRAAYNPVTGQILLCVWTQYTESGGTYGTYRDITFQYASNDLGGTLDCVEITDEDVWAPGAIDILCVDGVFHFYYVGVTDQLARLRKIANAYTPLSNAAVTQINTDPNSATTPVWGTVTGASPGDTFDRVELASCLDEDGTIYVYGLAFATQPHGMTLRSQDSGATWWQMGDSSSGSGTGPNGGFAHWHRNQAVALVPRPSDFCACWQRGRALVAGNSVTQAGSPTNPDGGISLRYLGNYSNVTMPGYLARLSPLDERCAWEEIYVPIDLPTAGTWTHPSAGGTVAMVAPGALSITTTAVQQDYYRYALDSTSGADVRGAIVLAENDVITGGATNADDIFLRINIGDAGHSHDVSLRYDSAAGGTITVIDNDGGPATLGTIVIDTTAVVQVLVAIDGDGAGAGSLEVWYRAGDTDSDQSWTVGISEDGTLGDGGAVGTAVVEFGNARTAAAAAQATWRIVCITENVYTGNQLIGFSAPDDLSGRQASSRAVSYDGGTRIKVSDGPVRRGDLWHADTAYEHPVSRVVPDESESPRVRWRSTGETKEIIAVALDAALLGTVESRPDCDTIGCAIIDTGGSWRTGLFRREDTAAGLVTVATIDLAYGRETMDYTLVGRTLVPQAASTDKPTFFRDEVAGYTARIGAKYRAVGSNSAGVWDLNTAGPPLLLQLEGIDGTEATPGAASLWSPRGAALAHLLGETTTEYVLEIDAQTTLDGYMELGALIMGPAYYFGRHPAWGRSYTLERGYEREQTPDGTTRRVQRQPPRHVIELAWERAGFDETDARGSTPNYVTASTDGSAIPVGFYSGAARDLFHLARRLDGKAVALVESVPRDASTSYMESRASHVHYGYIDADIRLEEVLGDPNSTQVLRVARLTFREIT